MNRDTSANIFNYELSRNIDTGNYSYPSRHDYESYLYEHGYVNELVWCWDEPELVKYAQRHWHHAGQNGCVFAQSIAYRQESIGWRSEVVYDLSDINLAILDQQIASAIDDQTNEVYSLLFPRITTDIDLVNLINWLTSSKYINIEHEANHGDYTGLGLRLPLGKNKDVLSWLVGFAPLNYLPITRQSPIAEIAIRTKIKPENIFYRLNQNTKEAHLADVPLGYNDKVMERLWLATKNHTSELLGGDEQRANEKLASAKITIAVPSNIWTPRLQTSL